MADLKGGKFRTVSVIGKMVEKWGGIPVLIAYPEIYEALNRKLITGAFGVPYANIYVSRFWEVARYIVDTGIGAYGLTITAISKKTYDSFPPDIKKIVDKLREDTNAQHRKWFEIHEKELTEKLFNEKTVELITWSPEEKAKAKNLVVPLIWEDWLKEMGELKLPGEEFLGIYKKAIAKYEAKYQYRSPYEYFRSLKKKQ
jgi:TRAP-type C4-dicarboxylate transport system substrate-binding protein